MLDKVRLALRITSNAYDEDLQGLIEAGLADLGLAGVLSENVTDPLIQRAVITYCRCNFGSPADYDRLKRSYDEQKAQLQTATGYTNWEGAS
jgi:hypothetical protein